MGNSFKVEVQTDSTGNWYGNAVRYPSKPMAESAARDLYGRWTAVREYRTVESEDPPNREHDHSVCGCTSNLDGSWTCGYKNPEYFGAA